MVVLSEELIRSRASIPGNPNKVSTLSLSGIRFQEKEKITHFGKSFQNFSGLSSLDVSRNYVYSLDGLDRLKNLRKLNVYFNNIDSKEEILKLKRNRRLADLDLRLNPVTKSDPNYRLFTLFHLPSLERLGNTYSEYIFLH
jgi:centrosomal protein CEP72